MVLGVGTWEGQITVAGQTLIGRCPALSRLMGDEDAATIEVNGTLQGVTVEGGWPGIQVAGEANLTDVMVTGSTWAGIAVEGGTLDATEVYIEGTKAEEGGAAIHVQGGTVQLADVYIAGVDTYGVRVGEGAQLDWTGGSIVGSRTFGILAEGDSNVVVEGVVIAEVGEGGEGITPAGIFVTGGASLEGVNLRVADVGGDGVYVAEGSNVTLTDSVIRDGHMPLSEATPAGLWLATGATGEVTDLEIAHVPG